MENKDSLPERLKKPRVYVEQMVDKYVRVNPLLPAKISGVQYIIKYRTVNTNRQCGYSRK